MNYIYIEILNKMKYSTNEKLYLKVSKKVKIVAENIAIVAAKK